MSSLLTAEELDVIREKNEILTILANDLSGRNGLPLEYKDIAKVINEKHNTKSNAQQVQGEFRTVINKLFSRMIKYFPKKQFEVLMVMSEEFNIPEEKFVRYLNRDNKSKIRNYAMKNYETKYYETKEKQKHRAKDIKKGRLREDIEDAFE